MKIKELIEQLKLLPQDKTILCQVVAQDAPEAWNMWFEFHDLPDMSWALQLRVYHPELKKLPEFK